MFAATVPSNIIEFQGERPQDDSALWQAVESSRKGLEAAWIAHHRAAMAIKDSRAWERMGYASFGECCEANKEVFYAESSYRVHQMSLRFVEALSLVANETALSEGQARVLLKRMKDHCPDKELWGITYQIASEKTGNIVPTEGELQAVYSVLEREKRHGVVSHHGEDLNVRNELVLNAVAEELYELKQRKISHIETSMGIESKRVAIPEYAPVLALLDTLGVSCDSELDFDFAIVWKRKKAGQS